MWEQEKDAWKKRQASYDPKDKAILDPIFAEAATTDNPNRNPSQNFNGSDYFEALVILCILRSWYPLSRSGPDTRLAHPSIDA
jgi:hypothetical protein